MARVSRQTVLVSVVEGRNFPKQSSSATLVVQCRFNGELLATDPVLAQSAPIWDTELAWDLDAKVLHFLRSQRASIRLDCWAVQSKARRELVGYLVLDLRSAQESSSPRESWTALLNPKANSSFRPEIKLAFSVSIHDNNGENTSANSLSALPHLPANQQQPALPAIPVPRQLPRPKASAKLDAGSKSVRSRTLSVEEKIGLERHENDYYKIGAGNSPFTLAVMVSGAQQLASLPIHLAADDNRGFALKQPLDGYYLYFSFLGEDILSPSFPTLSQCENMAFSKQFAIKSSVTELCKYLRQTAKLVLYLCHNTQILTFTDIDFLDLFDADTGRFQLLDKEYPLVSAKNEPQGLVESNACVNVSINISEGYLSTQIASSTLSSTIANKEGALTTAIGPTTTTTELPITEVVDSTVATNTMTHHKPNESVTTEHAPPLTNGQRWHQYRFSIDIRSLKDLQLNAANVYFRHAYPAFGTSSPFISQTPMQVFMNTEYAVLPNSFCAYEFVMSADRLRTFLDAVPLLLEVWHRDTHARDTQIGLATVRMNQVYMAPETTHPSGGCTIRLFDHYVVVTNQENEMWVRVAEVRVVLALEDFGELEQQDDGGNVRLDGIDKLSSPETVVPTDVESAIAAEATTTTTEAVSSRRNKNTIRPSFTKTVTKKSAKLEGDSDEAYDIRSTPEYKTALELELWKKAEEEKYLLQLRNKEQILLARLTEEVNKREQDRENVLRQKIIDFQTLENQLNHLVRDLEGRESKLINSEESLFQRRIELERDFEYRTAEQQLAIKELENDYQRQLAVERQRANDFEHKHTTMVRERDAIAEKLTITEQEYAQFKQIQINSPETALKAEVNSLTVELHRLNKELDLAKRSKAHYKSQWVKLVAEFARHKKLVQIEREEHLKRQQQELDELKHSLKIDQHNSSYQQSHQQTAEVAKLKSELDLLKSQTLSKSDYHHESPAISFAKTEPPSIVPQTYTYSQQAIQNPQSSLTPIVPAVVTNESSFRTTHIGVLPEIERLTKERDLLLKTGVYTSQDRLVIDLSTKINQLAMV